MFRVMANDVCIYSDAFALPNTRAVNPKLVLEDSAAGSLSITLPKENAGYTSVERLTTDISVERAGKVIWSGRVINDQKDFWNNRLLTCEGELAFFNDTTHPPHEYAALTIRQYMESLLNVHNSRVAANRQFLLGEVTVHDDAFPTRYTNNEKTIELLNALKEQYGGHLRVRDQDGKRYLDYLAECPKAATQTIQFGRNLIEFTRNWDSAEYATAIVPLGARLDKSAISALDAYLTVESVNGGSMYIQNESAVEAYGWIEKVVRWDDVTEPEQLLSNAKEYLNDLQFDNMQIELSAIDMRYLDPTVQPVELLDQIQVISRPHGLNRLFPLTKMEIPLAEPEKATFQLGNTVRTSLTKVNNEVSTKILKTIEELPKAHAILQSAKENADAIMSAATSGYITILQDDYGSESLVITPRPVAKKTTLDDLKQQFSNSHFWYWNANGLAHYGTYKENGVEKLMLKTAITMDGAIVADFVTAGTMSADRIRTGILKSEDDNVVFVLNSTDTDGYSGGSLTIKKGSITLGVTDDGKGNQVPAFTVTNDGILTARRGTFYGNIYADDGTFGGTLSAADGTLVGPLDIGDGKFTVDKYGSISAAGGKLTIDQYGNLSITGGSINIGNGQFVVKSDGTLTAKSGKFHGEININDNFIVSSEGKLTANTGIFKGTVQAAKFLTTTGDKTVPLYDMFNSGCTQITSGYLDLYGITIYKKNKYGQSTSEVSFQVDAYGAVTINGNITMGAGCSINWSTVTNVNAESAPGYLTAQNALTAANGASDTAAEAYDARCTAENVFNTLTNNGTKFGVFSSISGQLYINADYIHSGVLDASYITLASGNCGFKVGYGNDGDSYTSGPQMYSGNSYLIVTGSGCRMTVGSNEFYVTSAKTYSKVAVTDGSDRRMKHEIRYQMDDYEKLFMLLKPTQFQYNFDPSGFFHTGFIAQDVEDAVRAAGLPASAFAALDKTAVYGEDRESITDYSYGLRYSEFIALNTHMIQKLYRRVEALEERDKL